MYKEPSKNISCQDCTSSSCLVKKYFTNRILKEIEHEKETRYYKKEDTIFLEGDPIVGMNILMNGVVELFYDVQFNDKEIVRFVEQGDIFGHISIEKETYPSGAFAKDNSIVWFFGNDTLTKMYGYNPDFAFAIISFFSRSHNKIVLRLMQNNQMNLREKVADALLYLYNMGVDEKKEIKDCFNREDIARLAYTTGEQVSRQLTDFEKEKIIEKRSRKIAILAPEKLYKITHFYF
jgi:CRP/FNR family transcriptional regulator